MTSKSFDLVEPPTVDDGFMEVEVVVTPVEVQEMDRSFSDEEDAHAVMTGACAAGACVGCLVGGPVFACIAGAASAYGTTRDENSSVGDCTRSMGQLALSCRQKAMVVNENHKVVEKSRDAAVACWNKSRDMNERHRMAERTKGCLAASWEGTKDANRKYRIVDRAFEGIGRTVSYINDKVIGDDAAAPVTSPCSSEEVAVTTTASEEHPPEEEGESRPLARGDAKNGSYAAVKTDNLY